MKLGLKWKALACLALGAMAGFTLAISVELEKSIEMAKWSLGIFAFVWTTLLAFMAKLSDVTDVGGLTYKQHEALDLIVQVKIQRLWSVARFNVLGSCLGLVPVLILPSHPDWVIWMLPSQGALIGAALFCVLLYEHWLEELRAFRSKQKFDERLRLAREKLLKDSDGPTNMASDDAKQFEGFGRVVH